MHPRGTGESLPVCDNANKALELAKSCNLESAARGRLSLGAMMQNTARGCECLRDIVCGIKIN
jgi:hypothetical protein